MQCLGSGQWNDLVPKCYPLQTPSVALTAIFDKGKEEANALAKEMGIEEMKERDPTPEEDAKEEDTKEREAEEMMQEKSDEQAKQTKDKQHAQEEKDLKAKGVQQSMLPSNQAGSLEQLEHVAKHAQLELKRAEANRKDVEALVLANSASTSMAEAYGNTAALLSGKDALGSEKASEKRTQIIKNLLESGSPLYRDGSSSSSTLVDAVKENQQIQGRSAAAAAANVAVRFAEALLNDLMKSQPKNPDNEEQDAAERAQVLAQVSAAASKGGFAAGTAAGVDTEASAIKTGKIAGVQAAAEVVAPLLGITPEEVLKNNQDKLEKHLRSSMSAINNEPSSPSEMAASAEENSVKAADEMQSNMEKKKIKLQTTKENAVKAVQKEIEMKLATAEKEQDEAPTSGEDDNDNEENMQNAVVQGAETAVQQQLDVMAENDPAANSTSTSNDETANNQMTSQITQSIADEAVASALKAAKQQKEAEETEETEAAATSGPAERIAAAQEQADQATETQEVAQAEFEKSNAVHQQEVVAAQGRVDAEKETKKMVEQTTRAEEANDEASLDTAVGEATTNEEDVAAAPAERR